MSTATAARPAASRRGGGTLTGSATLVRFIVRRDRVRLALWIAGIALSVVSTAASFPGLYADAADRQARAELMSNPATVVIGGPGIGLDDYTFGAMLTNETLGFTAILIALMSIFIVVRHTRGDEEAGRTEVVRSSIVGRHAPLAAALCVAVATNLLLAVVMAAGLAALGVDSIDGAGSVLFAAALAGVGIVFSGVAAVTAQITEHSRGASGMAGLVLGAAYALRAVGDLSDGTLSWLSPIGWAHRTYAFVDNRWWPLLLFVALAAGLAVAAAALGSRRDVGAGLRPPPAGPPAASQRLASPLGLAFRLQRANLVGWVVALVAFGLVYGTLVGEVEGFAAEIDAVREMLAGFEGEFIDAFLSLVVSLIATVTGVFAVLASLRARAEETAGRAEPLLTVAVSRTRWVASHLIVAAAGSTVILLAGTLGLSVSGAISLGDPSIIPRLLGAALVYVPALLFLVGCAAALYGLVPSASAAVWAVLGYALAVGMLGGLLGLPDWMFDVSPFGAVPMLPADPFRIAPVALLTLVSALLLAAGLAGFRRRDLSTAA